MGFYDGSGDDNPSDKTHGTFFQVLPTPRPYARFPFFDMVNNRDINASLILRPHKQVTISSEFHALRLSSEKDLFGISVVERINLGPLAIRDGTREVRDHWPICTTPV